MATHYRKLGKAGKPRKALLRNQVTNLLHHGKIVTTETRAKEVRKIAEHLITLGIREKDNTETVTVRVKTPKKDASGKRVRQIVDKNDRTKVLSESTRGSDGKPIKREGEFENGITVTVFETTEKEVQRDKASRLHVRRQMRSFLYPVTELPEERKGRRKGTKRIDLTDKIFDEYAEKYKNRAGGYTRMVKIGQRKGDAAMMVVLEMI
ncbi:MAG: 50S ribosomal protein L17 [Lachnospiraceae bacterium]|nr:50S ribosomal protein L17 [Lachnospiraceae bacterium]